MLKEENKFSGLDTLFTADHPLGFLPWSKEGGWAEAGDAPWQEGIWSGKSRDQAGLRRQDRLGHMP